MAFKGGGAVCLTEGNTYTGITAVEVGTTLSVASQSDIKGTLVVTLPEKPVADNIYNLLTITGEGVFTQEFVDGIQVPDGCTILREADGKRIFCIYGEYNGSVWIGGANGNLSDASRWLNNEVPVGTGCIISCAVPGTLTLGDTFAPSAITFLRESALVTISGEREISGLTSIINNSTEHHVIGFPVNAENNQIELSLLLNNYLVFNGGISLKTMPSVKEMHLAGIWNLNGDWVGMPAGSTIVKDSTVNVSGTFFDGWNLNIENGATLKAAQAIARMGASDQNRLVYRNEGSIIIEGDIMDTIESDANKSYSLAGMFSVGGNDSVVRAKGLVNSASTKDNHQFRLNNSADKNINTIVLGAGGLSFKDCHRKHKACYPYFQVDSGKEVVLASSDDWSIAANPFKNPAVSLELVGTVTIDTSNYDDPSIGHVVRVIGKIGSSGKVIVKGCGKMTLESVINDFSGGLNIESSAIASIKPGCASSRSGISVAEGGTLELPESGIVALGGNLTINDGSILAFNFTSNSETPVLDVNGKSVILGEQGKILVKISAADGFRYPSFEKVSLTSGGKFGSANVMLAPGAPKWVKSVSVIDGDIVLEKKTLGLFLFVR
jgi:hypothetical protein